MRPIKLTLTAFGPYKDKEVIDFEKLMNNQLFVISGHTGSGKTTIFDGISFALYGAASGEDRDDTELLRSHFANDDLHTSAELIFELNGRQYRVLRQLGHVKKGNKTKTGDRYEFYEQIDHSEVPMVDRQNVTNINEKIEQLIGLTQDQFKQIVMLPQGEFRRLLTSETENKEEILRRLFQTDSYKQIGEHLKARQDFLQEEFNKIEQRRDHYIQMIHGTFAERPESELFQTLNANYNNVNQVITHLKTEIHYYEKKVKEQERATEKANKSYEEKHSHYFAAKQINESFIELREKKKQLASLKKQAEKIKENEKKLAEAEKANDVIPFEDTYNERLKSEKQRKETVERIKKENDDVTKALKKAETTYQTEKDNEEKRENLRKQHEQLIKILPTVENLAKHRTELKTKEKQLKQQRTYLKEIDKNIEKKMTEQKKINDKIAEYEQVTKDYVKSYTKLSDLRKKYEHLNEFSKIKDAYTKLINKVTNKEKEYQISERNYREKERIWLNDQAVILATSLKDNVPCPVCGGIDHPEKASHHVTGVSREEVDKLKNIFDKKSKIYNEAKATLNSKENELKLSRERVKEYGVGEENLQKEIAKTIEQGKKYNQKVEQIKQKEKQLDPLREKVKEIDKRLEKLTETKNKASEKEQTIQNKYTEVRVIYQERLTDVPEHLQQLDELNKAIQTTAEKREKLNKAWEQAEANLQAAKLKKTEVNSRLGVAKNERVTAQEERKKAKKALLNMIEKMEFVSLEQYKEAKLTKEKQRILKENIEQFKRQLDQVKRDVTTLEKRVKDKEKIDLTKLKAEVDQLKEKYELALNKSNTLKSTVKEAKSIKTNIKQEHENVREHEEKLRTVIDLYDVIRGQNEKRISFERYLQIGYLEQIIDAANERLKELSNGQFLLMRSERQETYGRQSGLALDIYDAYTGQARDVKSLSGGEKFNTSLCLALGMSDVIQSFQGGISIETMFIDEGFGSLDEESLNKALDTLIDLQQSGRMIGVISHVEQLKSIFPAVLEVTKLKEGYSETKFIIK